MPNFLLSRIAVNLLLIVAIAIQPVACCWAQSSCDGGMTRSLGDHSCGCCGDKDASKCCCQAKTADDPVDTQVVDTRRAQVNGAVTEESRVPACCATERGGQDNARSVDRAQGRHPH